MTFQKVGRFIMWSIIALACMKTFGQQVWTTDNAGINRCSTFYTDAIRQMGEYRTYLYLKQPVMSDEDKAVYDRLGNLQYDYALRPSLFVWQHYYDLYCTPSALAQVAVTLPPPVQ